MSFTLADIKKAKGGLESISAAMAKPTYARDDEGFFKLERDKAGNGAAVIRFLPKTKEDELPWITYYSHGFKGPSGRWYIEKSLTTLGKEDPIAEDNKRLWASGIEANKNIAKAHKRQQKWISNILVVSNPANPALEGKVMPFQYGKFVFDMLVEATKSDDLDPDKVAFNPFCPLTGANFKLRIRQDDQWPSYDKSGFSAPSALSDDEAKMVEILNQMTPLKGHIAPEKFKSYETLAKKFAETMGLETARTESVESMINSIGTAAPASKPAPAPAKSADAPEPAKSVAAAVVAESEDDIENYFKGLGNE